MELRNFFMKTDQYYVYDGTMQGLNDHLPEALATKTMWFNGNVRTRMPCPDDSAGGTVGSTGYGNLTNQFKKNIPMSNPRLRQMGEIFVDRDMLRFAGNISLYPFSKDEKDGTTRMNS